MTGDHPDCADVELVSAARHRSQPLQYSAAPWGGKCRRSGNGFSIRARESGQHCTNS